LFIFYFQKSLMPVDVKIVQPGLFREHRQFTHSERRATRLRRGVAKNIAANHGARQQFR
jgi:hypothetical protein